LTASVPVALAQFAFILGITVPFDIRDMAFDAPSLKTVPQLLGPSRSTRLALFAVAFSAGFFYIADPSPERMVVSILALPIVAIGVTPRRPFYYLILIDGLILLQGWSVPVL
jgi:4-hydroxybenzoate polyprenyltransferase